ncbi:MAG: hypothetical protein WCL50_03575 [Spirochaetota bacterium]
MTIETDKDSPVMEAALALLQAGVRVRCRSGDSARVFMREALGFDDGYIEGTVSTFFLDSEPVDDIDAARVKGGSRVALSAAMPGLVGAVMRRNSPYASLRAGISHDRHAADTADSPLPSEALVLVKLFNAVMMDRGPALLARGVIVDAEEAEKLARLGGLPFVLRAGDAGLVDLKVLVGNRGGA